MTSDKIKWIAAEAKRHDGSSGENLDSKTTLEYWALITEIAGAIVVSVVYLGLQIRGNTKVLRSQAHYNAMSLSS